MDNEYKALKSEYSEKDESYYSNERAELLKFVPENIKAVLDVGCGTGAFGAMLKRHRPGIEVWGVEPDRESADKAETKLDRVVCGTFLDSKDELEKKRFDLICFNDVLEHLVNPENTLEESKSLLTANGSILASIPNILYFYELLNILKTQDWKYQDEGILDRTHLRFFTRKSIERLFRETGYEVVMLEGIYPSYGMKFTLLNILTLGYISDFKFFQFAVRSQKKLK